MSKPNLIQRLENQIDLTLEQLPLENIYDELDKYGILRGLKAYSTDGNGEVIALFLDYIPILAYDYSILSKFNNLEVLSVRSNTISDYSFLKELKRINFLDLGGNRISDYSFLKELKSLNSLDLRGNQISDISFLKELKSLNSLDLRLNQISDISFLKELKSLNSLDLKSNRISDISFLKELKSLISLDLSRNQISDISFLKELKVLNSLNLSLNEISDISFLKELKSLNSLNLRSNKTIRLAEWICDFPNMEIEWTESGNTNIQLCNNPIEIPSIDIVKQGKEAIRNYFEQLKKEKGQYLFETKLLIIGEGGAGKTSFAIKMKDENAELPEDKDTTLGISVTKWGFEINHPKLSKQHMYTNFWDFGGQKLYQGTHQIFFSQKSFYVLLDESREEKTDFAYWLNTVEQLAGVESRMLIIANKKHGHVPQIDKNGLRARFGNLITNFETVDLLNDKEKIVALQNELKHLLPKLPGMGETLPASWVNIRKELFKINEKYISHDSYVEICKKHKTDITKLDFLSEHFNRIGVFTHYYDDKLLKNRVYLDSNWLLSSVYEVLNHPLVKDKEGRLNEQQLKQIWSNDEHWTETDYLSRLMHRFGMMYEILGNGSYVVPAHLPVEQPYENWKYEKDAEIMQFAYEFDKYMPRGIMPKLIVALHPLIKDHKKVWNKGVNICYESSHAEIKETYDKSNKVLIRISGHQKKELLGIIIHEFAKLLDPFKKLNYTKLVPCVCVDCKDNLDPHFYDFENLKMIKERGKRRFVYCIKKDEEVSIIELLDGVTDKSMNKEKIDGILAKQDKHKRDIAHKNTDNILIITATTKETTGILELTKIKLNKEIKVELIGEQAVSYLGNINNTGIYHAQCEAGSEGVSGSQAVISELIFELKLSSVLMPGIAFGLQKDKQSIGDIIISTHIRQYEKERRGRQIIPRGDRIPVSPKLLSLFRVIHQTWKESRLHFGVIMSGEKLVDDQDFTEYLLSIEPEAVGGEMEGVGLYSAAYRKKVDWILFKSIVDWGTGKTDEHQEKSSSLVSKLLFEVLPLLCK